uniref:Uncharacterized protein n=1 Tax=Moniliophthora roreri TaxID=221103 RepID=A0A0W0FB87_MONRR
MSNASSSSSDNSNSSCSLPQPPSGTSTHFSDDITYTGSFTPSPFELLFLPHLQFAIDGLIRLWAQRASLNAIIEETNVYTADLAFNATASRPTPLNLQGPMTVPSFPVHSNRLELQLHAQLSGLGPLPSDVCDSDPNDPEFLRATATYRARLGAAVELAQDQNQLCPRHTRAEPLLPGTVGSPFVVPKLESPSDLGFVKLEPDSDSPSKLTYPPDSTSPRDSTPIYAQSIGVASASPSPAAQPQPNAPPTSLPTPSFDPFDVHDEQLAPASVPFLADG